MTDKPAKRAVDALFASVREYRSAEAIGIAVISSACNLVERLELLKRKAAEAPRRGLHPKQGEVVSGPAQHGFLSGGLSDALLLFADTYPCMIEAHVVEVEKQAANLRAVLATLEGVLLRLPPAPQTARASPQRTPLSSDAAVPGMSGEELSASAAALAKFLAVDIARKRLLLASCDLFSPADGKILTAEWSADAHPPDDGSMGWAGVLDLATRVAGTTDVVTSPPN